MENPVIALLASRRSVKPDRLLEPGPKPQELETMLRIASRVPDHKKLAPWRFIVLEGDARARLGEVIAGACIAEEPERPSEVRLATERGRLQRAPLVVAVVSRVTPNRSAPEWEQILSAGAACFSLCLAANAMGYGTSWLTEWIAYSPRVRAALHLADNERIVGFVYVGTPAEPPPERDRPSLADIVSRWSE
jgi:nitroreductase